MKTENDLENARSKIEENKLWLQGQASNPVAAKALADSQKWLEATQEEICKQEGHLSDAAQQIRMHSYFVREKDTELSWLQSLREQLKDINLLQSVIARNF